LFFENLTGYKYGNLINFAIFLKSIAMYLAPLNYDRNFKKVFSETRIAKRFLEDFFDVEISEMELLPFKHKITDDQINDLR
jgi:hypothetical protein